MNIFGKAALVATLITAISPVAALAGAISEVNNSSLTIPLNVTAEVVANCAMKTWGHLDMGTYDPIGVNRSTDLLGNTKVEAYCTKGSELKITICDEVDLTNDYGSKLPVHLSFSSTGEQDKIYQDGHGFKHDNDVIVYGRIRHGHDAWVGHYSDNHKALVTFNF